MGFRLAQMAGLARQMQFTPSEQRGRQIAAAEQFLLELDAGKAYPFDYVVFKITGYHARPISKAGAGGESFTGHLLTGLALQHDLGLLVEQVSASLKVRVAELDEPVLTIEQVAQQFNASEKSIQRWRRRGLAARVFVYGDGRKRIGFLAASVERFLAVHHDRVARAANFTPIGAGERQRILAAARRLCAGGWWAEEIQRRIGRKLDRSPLTIGHVIGEHERLSPAAAPSDAERGEMVARFAAGEGLAELARGVGRRRAAVYRVLLDARVNQLEEAKVKFIDDSLYHQDDAAVIVERLARESGLEDEAPVESRRSPKDVPAYIAELYRTPLLTAARERGLFLKLHFHKYQFVTLRRKLEAEKARWKDVARLEAYLRQTTETRAQIVAANLRLVVSVARKHFTGKSAGLMDLVSDGNVTLMRAADAFDFHRGNRFSTYATLALMKEFARSAPAARRRDVAWVEDVGDKRAIAVPQRLGEIEQVDRLLSRLPMRERSVLRAQYGLSDEKVEDVARDWKLTPRRMKQIERTALALLRQDADE